MTIHLLSADQRAQGLAAVSRLGGVSARLGPDLLRAVRGLDGALVLGTCNRLAILLDAPDDLPAETLRDDVTASLAERSGSDQPVRPSLRSGRAAPCVPRAGRRGSRRASRGLLACAPALSARIGAGEPDSADTATSYRATARGLVALLAAALFIPPFRVSPAGLAAGAIGARPASGGSTIDAGTDDSSEATPGDSNDAANGGAHPATGSGSQDGGAGQASSSAKLELTTENFYSQVEDMIANGRAHDGQRVELTGFVLSPEAASAQASIPRVTDEESFAVARMAIWCCAADAYPVGFAVRWAGPAPAADSWVHVSGTLRVRGGKALVIEADSVTPAQTPNPEFVVQTR